MLDNPPWWLWAGCVGFMVTMVVFMGWARRVEGRALSGTNRLDEGRLIGVVGLPGFGKTSFAMSTYVIPALKAGRTVIANFSVVADDFPGRYIKLKTSNFGPDLLGIGSTLNVDEETGEAASGWFLDTACTCGKGHDESCSRPMGLVPAFPCCDGFRAWRQCPCNGAVLILDEGHAFVPANQSKPLPIDLLTWFTMCRKNHLMIIWMTQYYKWIHSSLRRLTLDVYMCEKQILAGHHIARLHKLDPMKGDISRDFISEMKYKIGPIGHLYDTSEVIIPAGTAYELAGEMSRRNIGPGAGGARHEHARPALRAVDGRRS